MGDTSISLRMEQGHDVYLGDGHLYNFSEITLKIQCKTKNYYEAPRGQGIIYVGPPLITKTLEHEMFCW